MGRAKVTVTMDQILVEELDRLSEERKESRSRLVEEAVKSWRRAMIEQELMEGYRAMANEDAETAEARLSAGFEALA